MKTIQELNEFLAEHLFGLHKGIKIGNDYAWNRAYPCENVHYSTPDYTKNYQPILEKLLELGWSITRLSPVVDKGMLNPKRYVCEINHSYLTSPQYRGYGGNLGEAICRCAVSYLESKEKE